MNYFTNLKPNLFFIILASLFGSIILIITPPFQVPDEINHFFRAYQISEGGFIPLKQNNRVGGYVPASLVKITEPFLGLRWYNQSKTSYKSIVKQFNIPLAPEKKTFADFPNTGMYSPIAYFPQSIAIFILRMFKLPPLLIFYGARLSALLFWIAGIYYVISIIPFNKWLFTLIALLPMSVFINMSLSADVVTNVVTFITMAYILKLRCSTEILTIKNFIIILLLSISLASTKLVYTPILLLFLLIPKKNFQNKNVYYYHLFILLAITCGTILFWSRLIDSLYIPYAEYNIQFRDNATLIKDANLHNQLQYILNHGLYLYHVFIKSLINTFDMYFEGYIGTFGWLDTKLPIWVVYSAYFILFFVAFMDGDKMYEFKMKDRIILLISLLITICLILLSQHLTWDVVGGDIIATIQGRYFIPIFPFLFMLFYNSKFKSPKTIVPLIIIFSLVSLSITINTLCSRYF